MIMEVEGKVELAEHITQIFKYASFAPNSHNSQPWKIKVLSDSEFIVQSDPERWLPIENVRNQVNNCSGFIVIISDDLGVHSMLEAGRNFEKLALKCTELGVAIQPMSQLMEESPWNEELESSLELSKPVQLVLRAGYSRKRPERSVRRPVEEIII